MFVLEEKSTGEIVTVNDLSGYVGISGKLLPEYELLGECDEVPDCGVWDKGSKSWVHCDKLEGLVTEREWNRMPKAVRAHLFKQEARIFMLEEAVMALQKKEG